MKRIFIGVSLIGLIAGWVLIGVYVFWWGPWQKQIFAAGVAGLQHSQGSTILIGDSILHHLGTHCPRAINVSVSGASIRDVPGVVSKWIKQRGTSNIVVLLGINDLRAGASPADVADRLTLLAGELKRASPPARVTVLSILPITENEISLEASNLKIQEANRLLATAAESEAFEFIDISHRFGGKELRRELTYDGLHPNAAGKAELNTLLFDGIAFRPSNATGWCID